MTDAKLKEIYTIACDTKGYDINPGQAKEWKAQLGFYEASDLEAAVRKWYETNTDFPMPAQLRGLAEAERRRRIAPKSGYEYTTGYRCPRCRVTVTSFQPARELKCPQCWNNQQYALMSVEMQDRKQIGGDKWEDITPQPDRRDERWQ